MTKGLHGLRGVLTSALGITILLGTPLIAQADQGKWWKPKEGDPRVERRDRTWDGRGQGARGQGGWQRGGAQRGDQRGGSWQRERGGANVRDRIVRDGRFRGDVRFDGPRYSGHASWGGWSGWRGVPVRRDFLVIRDRRYGGFFRARRVFVAPRFYGRFVYVRPVRYFIAADAFIGPIGLRARIVRPHYLYGCNFCDARFDSYEAYCDHVEHCPYRPDGCDVSVSNWDDDGNWDGPYQTDDGYRNDDRHYDDQGAYDDRNDDEDDGGYYDDGR